ncbi:hypothetical protein [Novosphingobium rosa]|nr:hypothetical protein [Novosphingobium rosa]
MMLIIRVTMRVDGVIAIAMMLTAKEFFDDGAKKIYRTPISLARMSLVME